MTTRSTPPLWKQLLGAAVGSLCALMVYAAYVGVSDAIGADLSGSLMNLTAGIIGTEDPSTVVVAASSSSTSSASMAAVVEEARKVTLGVFATSSSSSSAKAVAKSASLPQSGLPEVLWATVALGLTAAVHRRRLADWMRFSAERLHW